MNRNIIIQIVSVSITTFISIFGLVTGAAYFNIPLLSGSGMYGIINIILLSIIVGLIFGLYKYSNIHQDSSSEKTRILREQVDDLNEEIRDLKYQNLKLVENAELMRYHKQPKKSKMNSIGIVAPIIRFPTTYFLETIRSIRNAGKNDMNLVLFDINKEKTDEVRAFFKEKKFINLVDGLITISVDIPQDDLNALSKIKFPVVNIYNDITTKPIVANINPNFSGFHDLVEHLIEKHYSQQLFLVTRPLINPLKFLKIDKYRKERRDIFYKILDQHNIAYSNTVFDINSLDSTFDADISAVIETRDYSLDVGNKIFSAMEKQLRHNTAIVCLADTVAAGVLKAAYEKDFDINGMRLRVTGFDNSYLAEFYDLSSIDYNLPLTGELAYQRIHIALSNLERGGDLMPLVEEYVNTEFVPRGSCCYT